MSFARIPRLPMHPLWWCISQVAKEVAVCIVSHVLAKQAESRMNPPDTSCPGSGADACPQADGGACGARGHACRRERN